MKANGTYTVKKWNEKAYQHLGVLVAAAGVSHFGSAWPDIAIGLLVAAAFCRSSIQVLCDAAREFQFSN